MRKAYISNPPKDVGVEAYVVLRDIDTALNQNFALQCTPIVYKTIMIRVFPANDKQTHTDLRSDNRHRVYSKTTHGNQHSFCYWLPQSQ